MVFGVPLVRLGTSKRSICMKTVCMKTVKLLPNQVTITATKDGGTKIYIGESQIGFLSKVQFKQDVEGTICIPQITLTFANTSGVQEMGKIRALLEANGWLGRFVFEDSTSRNN